MLAVQGPPGTGKTYAGSALVRELLDAGLRVGVTAQSHAVVLNLLGEVARPAWHKDGSKAEARDEAADPDALVRHTSDNAEIAAALASGDATLVGGTAWLWSRDDMVDAVDVSRDRRGGPVLPGQRRRGGSPPARSLVLLGDPLQLRQPTKAVHPYGSGVSALDHLRTRTEGGIEVVHDVIPDDRGLSLDGPSGMPPSLTRFVSELAYEGRLESAPGRSALHRHRSGALAGDGLRWCPVVHTVVSDPGEPGGGRRRARPRRRPARR